MSSKIIEYLDAVAFRVAILKSAEEDYELQLSNKFNLLRYVNIDENQMSRIFADLLNPKGEHGQKSAYLDAFMNILGVSKQNGLPKVDTEVRTNSIESDKRRIDILISWSDFAIAIENKPWAKDQESQLSDYAAHLKNKYNDNYLLVYLSETEPSEGSISKKEIKELGDKYQHIFYSRIIKWLSACINVSQSEKMRYFLKDFQTIIKNYFSNMTTENSEIVKYSLSSLDNLAAACEVINAQQGIKNAIAKAFVGKLKDKLKDEYKGSDIKDETDGEYIRISFTKTHWASEACCKIGHDPNDTVYFSAWQSTDEKLYDFLREKIKKGTYKNGHFHHYIPTKDGYGVWNKSTTGMKAMHTEESVDYFFKEMQLLIGAVDEYHTQNKTA